MKKALIVFDPFDMGRYLDHIIFEVINFFSGLKYQVVVYGKLCKEEDISGFLQFKEYNLIICCGSQSILNYMIFSVVSFSMDIPLVYIPHTVTDMLLPRNFMEELNEGVMNITQKINVGKFNNDFFIYEVSFGILSDPFYNRLSRVQIMRYLKLLYENRMNFRQIESYHAIVTNDNIRIEGEYISICLHNTRGNDNGIMEIVLIEKPQSLAEVLAIFRYSMEKKARPKCVHSLQANQVHIRSDNIEWTLDGAKKIVCNDITVSMLQQRVLTMGV